MTRRFSPAGLLGLLLAVPAVGQPQTPPALVGLAEVVKRDVPRGQTFVGTVRPVRVSTVGSAVDGRVEEFYVNEGDRVYGPSWFGPGQPLAKLRTRTLELERDAAAAEADALAAALQELERSFPEQEEQARAALASAEANARYAKLKLQRTRELFRLQGSAAQEEYEEAVSLADQAEQDVMQARAALGLLRRATPEKIAQARARMASQREVVNRLNDQISLHTIRAPFTGYVTAENTEVGQWVKQGDPVVELIELDEVDVEVMVTEEVIGGVQLGEEVRVEVPAVRDRPFTGRVQLIVPQADPQARTFPVKIRVPNQFDGGRPLLRSNMFARATLAVGRSEEALLVPKDALVLGGPVPVIFVAEPDPKNPEALTAKLVPVELGVADGGLIQVKGPVQPGQKVVVRGNERLRPGQPLALSAELGARNAER